mgnify:CR=1 FL=1
MESSLCGIDCTACELRAGCHGCRKTKGRPFGGACVVAEWKKAGDGALDAYKAQLLAAFHNLPIRELGQVQKLYSLKGAYINLPCRLPNGQVVKFWEDDRIYLGNQVPKGEENRFYGLAADETYLLVCEYGLQDQVANLVAFQRWNQEAN